MNRFSLVRGGPSKGTYGKYTKNPQKSTNS